MTTWKPTLVQQDVIDRLKDGWELRRFSQSELMKQGEAPRHVGNATVDSLLYRDLITWDGNDGKWVLVDGADA